jgi:50S ribosomal subunit-associated GTPase HflX
MYRHRGPDRRPAPRARPAQVRVPAQDFAAERTEVVIVGYFSGREKDHAAQMDAAARELSALGARVVGRIAQRRGVSRGGARKMGLPLSPRTLLGGGKAREAAALRERTGADAAVFLSPLSPQQRRVLTELLGCPVLSLADLRGQDPYR